MTFVKVVIKYKYDILVFKWDLLCKYPPQRKGMVQFNHVVYSLDRMKI